MTARQPGIRHGSIDPSVNDPPRRTSADDAETGPSADDEANAATYDGRSARELAAALSVPEVLLFDSIGSTLDAAHAAAAGGAPAGTLVLADAQTAGRGRMGRSWQSETGRGIWLTVIERPASLEGIPVLSLRIGLHTAHALDPFTSSSVQLKWPNDLYVDGRKLGGILVEARWRAEHLDWIAIGFGVNVRPPADLPAAGLIPAITRYEALLAVVPALRAASAAGGPLTAAERDAFALRDLARGRRCIEPVAGIVVGIDTLGALLVDAPSGRHTIRSGSLVLEPLIESSQQEIAP